MTGAKRETHSNKNSLIKTKACVGKKRYHSERSLMKRASKIQQKWSDGRNRENPAMFNIDFLNDLGASPSRRNAILFEYVFLRA